MVVGESRALGLASVRARVGALRLHGALSAALFLLSDLMTDSGEAFVRSGAVGGEQRDAGRTTVACVELVLTPCIAASLRASSCPTSPSRLSVVVSVCVYFLSAMAVAKLLREFTPSPVH